MFLQPIRFVPFTKPELRLVWSGRTRVLHSEDLKAEDRILLIDKHLINRIYLGSLFSASSECEPRIAVKIANTEDQLERLEREAHVYSFWLKHLQGTSIPIMLGFYRGIVDCRPFGCMLMEYVDGPRGDRDGYCEGVLKIMNDVHRAGVYHNHLAGYHQHFVRDHQGRARVLNFSRAELNHWCNPPPPPPEKRDPDEAYCDELLDLEVAFGEESRRRAKEDPLCVSWPGRMPAHS